MENDTSRYMLHVSYSDLASGNFLPLDAMTFGRPTFAQALIALFKLPLDQFDPITSAKAGFERMINSAQIIDMASGYQMVTTSREHHPNFPDDTRVALRFGGGVLGRHFSSFFNRRSGEYDNDNTKVLDFLRLDPATGLLYPTHTYLQISDAIYRSAVHSIAAAHPGQWLAEFEGYPNKMGGAGASAVAAEPVTKEIHAFGTEQEAIIKLLSTPGTTFDPRSVLATNASMGYIRADLEHRSLVGRDLHIFVVPPVPRQEKTSLTANGRFLLSLAGWKSVLEAAGIPLQEQQPHLKDGKVLKLDYWSESEPRQLLATQAYHHLYASVQSQKEKMTQNRYRAHTEVPDAPFGILQDMQGKTPKHVNNHFYTNNLLSAMREILSIDWRHFNPGKLDDSSHSNSLPTAYIADKQDWKIAQLQMVPAGQGQTTGLYLEMHDRVAQDASWQLYAAKALISQSIISVNEAGYNRALLVDYSGPSPLETPFFIRFKELLALHELDQQLRLRPEIAVMPTPSLLNTHRYYLEMAWMPLEQPILVSEPTPYVFKTGYPDLDTAMRRIAEIPRGLLLIKDQLEMGIPYYLSAVSLVNNDNGQEILRKISQGFEHGQWLQWFPDNSTPAETAAYKRWEVTLMPAFGRVKDPPAHHPPREQRPDSDNGKGHKPGH